MPIAGHDSVIEPYFCFDVPAGTGNETNGPEEGRAHCDIPGGEDQPLMPGIHNVVQSMVYEHGEIESIHLSTELRAQRMSMGSIEK